MPRKLLVVLAVMSMLAVVAAGCGGDDDDDGANEGAATTAEGSDVRPDATLDVRVAERGSEFGDTTEAGDGDTVILRARVKNADERPTLRFLVPGRQSESIQVALADSNQQPVDTATIEAARGTIQVNAVRYVCRVGENTFCPVEGRQTADGFEIEAVTPSPAVPVVFQLGITPAEGSGNRERRGDDSEGGGGDGGDGGSDES